MEGSVARYEGEIVDHFLYCSSPTVSARADLTTSSADTVEVQAAVPHHYVLLPITLTPWRSSIARPDPGHIPYHFHFPNSFTQHSSIQFTILLYFPIVTSISLITISMFPCSRRPAHPFRSSPRCPPPPVAVINFLNVHAGCILR